MRYVAATFGAIFIFLSVVLIGFVVNNFLPPALRPNIVIFQLGVVSIWGTPAVLVGIVLGGLAAIHSFRSTLQRWAIKSESNRVPAQED